MEKRKSRNCIGTDWQKSIKTARLDTFRDVPSLETPLSNGIMSSAKITTNNGLCNSAPNDNI
jgi:hypothetical protein